MELRLFQRVPHILVVAWVLGCQERIQHGLDERQANELLTVLVERGFEVRKVPEPGKKPTWAIEVDSERSADAVRVLAELGLPRSKAPTTIDVLGGGGLVPTPSEERARQVVGLAGDLAATLETVDGVTSARVHLVLPQPARSGQPPGQAKASAFLRIRPGAAERIERKKSQLEALIAGSVEGLSPEQVTLVIAEVETSVPPQQRDISPLGRLRWLVLGLAITTTTLALGLVLLATRLKRCRPVPASPPRAAPGPARPTAAPSASRRAA